MLRQLQPLLHRVLEEPHPTELAHHMDAPPVRLEVGLEVPEIHTSLRAAEDQADGAYWALVCTAPVPNTVRGADQLRLSVGDPQDVSLRARL